MIRQPITIVYQKKINLLIVITLPQSLIKIKGTQLTNEAPRLLRLLISLLLISNETNKFTSQLTLTSMVKKLNSWATSLTSLQVWIEASIKNLVCKSHPQMNSKIGRIKKQRQLVANYRNLSNRTILLGMINLKSSQSLNSMKFLDHFKFQLVNHQNQRLKKISNTSQLLVQIKLIDNTLQRMK